MHRGFAWRKVLTHSRSKPPWWKAYDHSCLQLTFNVAFIVLFRQFGQDCTGYAQQLRGDNEPPRRRKRKAVRHPSRIRSLRSKPNPTTGALLHVTACAATDAALAMIVPRSREVGLTRSADPPLPQASHRA